MKTLGVSVRVIAASLLGASLLGACGGGTASGAAMQVSIYPSDRGRVNGRRLESLARQFEQQYPCTAEDTISVQGVAPMTYTAEGCGHMLVYQLQCRAGAYTQICDWLPVADDLMARAATDMSCSPDTMDMQPAAGMGRTVMGCGYSATYVLQCQGSCMWQMAGPLTQTGAAAGGGNTVTVSGGGNSYIQQ